MDEVEKQAKQYLESLGEPALPDSLRGRVEGARRQHMRRRFAGAATASVAAVAVAFALVVPGGLVEPEGGPELASDASEVPPQAAPGGDADRIRSVHVIDRALQAAYDRNATDDEIEPLWRARHALMAAATPPAAKSKG